MIPRRRLLTLGLLVFSLVYLGFSAASSAWHFWALFSAYGVYMAATDGVGKALIVDLVPSDFKATGIGMFATVSGFATIFASTAGGFLWDHFGSSSPFYYGAFGSTLAAILILFQTKSIIPGQNH